MSEDIPKREGSLWGVAVLIFSWMLLLLVNQFRTLAKITENLPPNARFGSWQRFSEFASRPDSPLNFDGLDKLVFWLLFLLPLAVLWLEFQNGAITRLVRLLDAKRWLLLLLLAVFFAVLSRHYLHPGDFTYTGDAAPMLGSISEAQLGFENGVFPNFSTLAYGGWNCRQYLGHLFSWTGGLFAAAFGLEAGVKLLMLLFNAASGFFLYLWVLKITRNRTAALTGAVAYTLNAWHFQQVVTMGRINVSAIYAQLPLVFWLFECLLRDRQKIFRYTFLLAATLGWTLLTHLVWGAGIVGLLLLYALPRLYSIRRDPDKKRILIHLLLVVLLTGIFSGGTLLSIKVRADQSMATVFGEHTAPHNVDYSKRILPHTLFKWTSGWMSPFDIPPRSWYNSYLGFTPLLLSLLAFLLYAGPWKERENSALIATTLLGIVTFLLLFAYFTLIKLPLIGKIRIFPDHRYQTFLVFAMSALASFGVLWWSRFLRKIPRHPGVVRVLTLLPLVLVGLDIGGTSFQFPFGKSQPWVSDSPVWKAYGHEAEKSLERGEYLPWRLFVEGKSSYDYLLRTPGLSMARLHLPSDQGPHNHLAPRQSQYGCQFYETFQSELEATRIQGSKPFPSRFATDWFYLNNFRDAILFQSSRTFDSSAIAAAKPIGNGLALARFRFNSPAVASDRLASWTWRDRYELKKSDQLQELFRSMDIQRSSAIASSLFFNSEKPAPEVRVAKSSENVRLQIQGLKVLPKSYTYELESNRDTWVRLHASWYDYLDVRIDGKKVEFWPSATWNILIRLPAGKHVVTVEGGWDPFIFWTGLPALLILFLGAFVAWRRPGALF